MCSVGVHKVSELEEFQARMESSQLKTFNLTKSDLVKDHLRYLVNILWMNFNFFLMIWFLYFILYIRHGFPKKPWKLSYIDWSSLQGEPRFISHNCIIKKETLCMGSYGVKNIDAVMKTSYIDQKKWFFYWSLIKCCIRWVLIMKIPTLQASSLLVCLSFLRYTMYSHLWFSTFCLYLFLSYLYLFQALSVHHREHDVMQ